MNRHILQGNWKQFEGEARRRWGKLTDDDLDVVKGDAEILIGKVQERYGQQQDQAERDVNDWLKTMGPEPQPGEPQ
jgi:uncharacterized protein YjbJ (UPF0337 family)